MSKESIHLKDMLILNTSASNNRASKCMKKNMTDLQAKSSNQQLYAEASLYLDRTGSQKIRNTELNNAIDLINTYRTPPKDRRIAYFSSTYLPRSMIS